MPGCPAPSACTATGRPERARYQSARSKKWTGSSRIHEPTRRLVVAPARRALPIGMAEQRDVDVLRAADRALVDQRADAAPLRRQPALQPDARAAPWMRSPPRRCGRSRQSCWPSASRAARACRPRARRSQSAHGDGWAWRRRWPRSPGRSISASQSRCTAASGKSARAALALASLGAAMATRRPSAASAMERA